MAEMRPPDAPALLTVKQFMRRLPAGVSETTVRRMVAEHRIRSVRIGSGRGRIFIPITELSVILSVIHASHDAAVDAAHQRRRPPD